jgi:Holliday junction resolvasome RuvABC DNA-binding subunit
MHQVQAASERALTLNERLNKTLETLGYQCERIEAVLSRVNGTPQKIEAAQAGKAPRPVLSMQNAVESLEATTQRLIDLTGNVEHIA